MIKILPKDTIDQIAAGEIIESPINVVKELIENAIDADASNITIEIQKSGKRFIRVIDNGIGMNKKDLKLSIKRYATSKIKHFHDLSYITSLGFRGEALASILIVSKLKIKTRTKKSSHGWELSNYDNIIQITPWYGQEGTIVEIEDLFFNVPTRQKFLKSDLTELIKIIKYIEIISLARYDINFRLISNSKLILYTKSTDSRINRITNILGSDFSKMLHNFNTVNNKISLDIYFTKPNESLNNNKFQYLFINLRPVRYSRDIKLCIYQVYKKFIPYNKHPGLLLYLNINTTDVDINIHPMKKEVKLLNEEKLCDLLHHIFLKQFKVKNFLDIITTSSHRLIQRNKQISKFMLQDNDNMLRCIKVIGKVFEVYILVENKQDNKLYIFDQHAAAERITYEQYMYEIHNNKIIIQKQLIPEIFNCPISIAKKIKVVLPILNKLGIILEEFGYNSFKVLGYPIILGNISSIKHVILQIISNLNQRHTNINVEIIEKVDLLKEIIVKSACHNSIKANEKLSDLEITHLISQLVKCKYPFACPHGRPTAYKMSFLELKRYFKR